MSRWLPRWRPRSALCGMDAQRIAWIEGGLVRVATHCDVSQALANVHGSVDIVAGNDLAVHWIQQPTAAVQSLQELQLVAAARCAHLHGGSPGEWWIAADWSLGRPFVCAALPRAVTQPLQRAAHDVRIRWHTAFGIVAGRLARGLADEGWSAMRTPARVLLWHCRGGRTDALTGFAIEAAASDKAVDAQLRMHLQLEATMTGNTMPQAVEWSPSDARTARSPTEAQAALALAHFLHGETP